MKTSDYLEYAAMKVRRMEDDYQSLIVQLLEEVFPQEDDQEIAIQFFRDSLHDFSEFSGIPELEKFKLKVDAMRLPSMRLIC